MHLKEYIEQAKKELDEMEAKWIEENKTNPTMWPMEMEYVTKKYLVVLLLCVMRHPPKQAATIANHKIHG